MPDHPPRGTVQLNVSVRPELLAALRGHCMRTGIRLGFFVAEAVFEKLRTNGDRETRRLLDKVDAVTRPPEAARK